MSARSIAILTVLAVLGSSGRSAAGGGEDLVPVDLHAIAVEERDRMADPVPVVDRLAEGDVLDVRVTGGAGSVRGTVRQCRRELTGYSGCHNTFPVQFDADGRARFQYRLDDPGGCGPAGTCAIVVEDVALERRAVASLVFGAAALPPPEVAISPSTHVEEGDEVRVAVAGLTPGATVQIGYCAPDCGRFVRVGADDGGRASAMVTVGAPCPGCGIAVVGGAHDSLTPVDFAPPPRPRYDIRRLAIGLLVAATLIVVALRIVRAVDWRPPSEAATPELDAVEL